MFYKNFTVTNDIVPYKTGEHFTFVEGINLFCGDQGCGKSTLLQMLMNHKEYDVYIDPKYYKRGEDIGLSFNYMNQVGVKNNTKHVKEEFADFLTVEYTDLKPTNSLYFDTERQNPRILSGNNGSRDELILLRDFLNFSAEKNPNLYDELMVIAPEYASKLKSNMTEFEMVNSKFKSHGQVLYPMLEQIGNSENSLIFLDEPETSLSIRSQYRLVKLLKKAVSNGCQIFIATHSPILIESVPAILSLEHRKWMPSSDFVMSQLS